jgi:hypothetical protein
MHATVKWIHWIRLGNAIGKWRDMDGNSPWTRVAFFPMGNVLLASPDARHPFLAASAILTDADGEDADLCARLRLKPYDSRTVDSINRLNGE